MESGALYIRNGFDAELDRLRFQCIYFCGSPQSLSHGRREVRGNLETHLTAAAHAVLEMAPLLPHVTVEYVHQVGYLVAVAEPHVQFLQSLGSAPIPDELDPGYESVLDPSAAPHRPTSSRDEFQFVFKEDGIHYYKHDVVYALDDSLGDCHTLIEDKQKALMLGLEEQVLDHECELQQMSAAMAQLDAVISLGTVAQLFIFPLSLIAAVYICRCVAFAAGTISYEMKFVRPTIVEQHVVVIKNGRHPLQELVIDTFVPNDTYITETKNVALITGTSAGWKAVHYASY